MPDCYIEFISDQQIVSCMFIFDCRFDFETEIMPDTECLTLTCQGKKFETACSYQKKLCFFSKVGRVGLCPFDPSQVGRGSKSPPPLYLLVSYYQTHIL